ncbi:MAG: hypothetical protein HC888_18135 [Candidatus Competibacteraceae bacterium]|nr:hypothetical protein [Candidatus Competibacteraceae bacterium]
MGKFIIIPGDDDALTPSALQQIVDAWNSIPEQQRSSFCGVCGLTQDPQGNIVGDRFPSDIVDSDFFKCASYKGSVGTSEKRF